MKSFIPVLVLAMVFTACSTPSDEHKPDNFLVNNVAIDGYDPVAYFVEKEPVKGSVSFAVEHGGIIYHLSSQKNVALFKENPDKYKPAYGGWCAYAIAENSFKMEPDPTNWQIQNGQLQLFYEDFWTELQGGLKKEWNEDPDSYKARADKNWHDILGE
jgi:YHS domain-containing protein